MNLLKRRTLWQKIVFIYIILALKWKERKKTQIINEGFVFDDAYNEDGCFDFDKVSEEIIKRTGCQEVLTYDFRRVEEK